MRPNAGNITDEEAARPRVAPTLPRARDAMAFDIVPALRVSNPE